MARSPRDRHGGRGGGRRPRAIALVGIDGSGKTTQAHRLAEALTAAGLPARYRQNAGGRRWLGRLARRLGRRDAQRLLGRNGMVVAESTLRWLAIARTLVRSACGRRIAVMDRYAVCQYASTRAHRVPAWEPVARLCYWIFPAPDLTILLAVDPAEAYRRIELRGTDEESPAFLAAADAAYRSLPEFPEFVVIDANGPPDEVTRAIAGQLRRWLRPEQPRATRREQPRVTRREQTRVTGSEEPATDQPRPDDPLAHRHRSERPVPTPG